MQMHFDEIEPWCRLLAVAGRHDRRLRTRDRARGAPPSPPETAEAPTGFLIANVLLVDGSGAAPVAGAVRVEGGTIAAVGELEPLTGERMIDGGGQVLAPGFIDTHSHAADGSWRTS